PALAAEGQDLDGSQISPRASVHAHALLRLVAENVDPVSARVRNDRRRDLEAVDRRRSHLHVVAVVEQQDAVHLHLRARLGREAIDQDLVARGDTVLLSTPDDDSRQRTVWLSHGATFYQVGAIRTRRTSSVCTCPS